MAFEQSRRGFLKMTLAGGAAAFAATRWSRPTRAGAPGAPGAPGARSIPAPAAVTTAAVAKSQVALTTGEDRADIAFKALKTFEKEIAAAIGDKRIILKPNNVIASNALACTDVKNLEGILEFLKSIGKIGAVTIAESGAGGATLDGFAGLGYNPLAAKYNVKLMDLDKEAFDVIPTIDQNTMRANPCRVSKILLDPSNFVISATKTKTHDSVVATLSLKNIAMGAPLKVGGRSNDKRLVHGSGPWAINFNLANFATRLHPHLSVIDGYQGMEGNGPVQGTPVEHRVCVVGLDWLAADRVGLELMGIDPAKVGYLTFCSQMGLGQYNLDRIDVIGEAVKDHIKTYKLSTSIDNQLKWMNPPARITG